MSSELLAAVRSTVTNIVLVLASSVAAFAAYTIYAEDDRSRRPAEEFAAQYTMPLRRPDVATTLQYAPSSDFAIDFIADATLRDVSVPVQLWRFDPRARAAWIDAVPRFDEQMHRATDLELDAIRLRPGWSYHQALLGQLVYTRGARALSPSLVTQSRRWSVPLSIGVRAATNDVELRDFLALAYLQTWPDLAAVHAKAAPEVFRGAFEDAAFVRASFDQASQILGREAAISYLPDSPKALWAAFEQLASSGATVDAWRVHQRWDAAEWRQRQRDIDEIERAVTRGDIYGAQQLCLAWTAAHSVWDYDSPAAHAQAARILDLWPVSDNGGWPNDPRVDLIRYFLAGRSDGIDGAVLARAATPVSGIPPPTQAEICVLASDIGGADSIARASDSFGSFEWKTYSVDLARYWLRKGDRAKAGAALAKLPPAARDECEALTAFAAVNGASPAPSPDITLMWTGSADVPLCFSKKTGATLTLTLAGSTPVIVDYGWDRARSGSVLLSPDAQQSEVTLPSAEGMRTVSVRALAQPVETPVSLEVKPLT